MRDWAIAEFAARIRPRKYEVKSATGRSSGIRESVDAAGSREPWRESKERAGCRFGLYGGGGVRYRESSVW